MKRIGCLLLAVCVCFVLAVESSRAQVNVSPQSRAKGWDRPVFGLGVGVGLLSGAGFSFRHHLPERFSYQITGGIIKIESNLSYDIGLELQFDLVNAQTRFYGLVGTGYYYAGTSSRNDMKAPFRFGAGAGVEWNVSGGFHFTLAGALTYFSDGDILPLPQCGLYFYFL